MRDTSGRGNDAVFRGSSSYDAIEKAFNLTSHDKDLVVVRDNISGVSGDILGTISLWFKTNDTTQTASMTMFQIGHANTTGHKLMMFLYEDDVYMGWGGSNYVYAPSGDVKRGRWTHVVGIKKGTGAVGNGTVQSGHTAVLELYIDGVKKAVTNWTGTDTLNITKGNQIITVGAGSIDSATRSNGFDGFISTVKFWGGVALTASEVKTLYDMGRCDEGHHVVNFSKTRVGIGLGDGEAPRSTLDVRGGIAIGNTTGQVGPLHIKFSTDAARNSGTRFEDASSTNYWENWINNGDYFYFAYNGSDRGYIQGPGGAGATQMPNFTGQHMTFIKDISFIQAGELEGLIVSSDQNKYIKMSGGIEAGSNAITTNESLPIVSLSNVVTDKKCFGVISASEDPETRTVLYGAWGSVAEKEKGDTRVYINSVGEGAIWVVNTNGSLESGDYITTSNVAGYGQKQDSAGLMNYTVAKITMDCDFEPATQPIQIIKKDEEGENILDEHEQIQWEDHPTDTEKAYKIRYLDAQGAQTDEANAVHIAAFVGCTYHCG